MESTFISLADPEKKAQKINESDSVNVPGLFTAPFITHELRGNVNVFGSGLDSPEIGVRPV
jgi:hypothetical protein